MRLFDLLIFFSFINRRTFGKKGAAPNTSRSFVQFIIEPLYKILAHVNSLILFCIFSRRIFFSIGRW